jgi:PAS domain S-box-containing protein
MLPQKMSKSLAITLSLVSLACVGFVDFASGDLTFVLFYFLPIGIAAWFVGRIAGIGLCFLAVVLWIQDYLIFNYHGLRSTCWDTAITLGTFLCYSLTLSASKKSKDAVEAASHDLERRVRERTAALNEANQVLRRSEERLRMALRTAPIFMSMTDPNLHYTWLYNPLVSKPEEVIGCGPETLLPPDEAAQLNTIHRKVMETRDELHQEMLLHIKGHEIYYDVSFAPFKNEGGEVEGITTVALDITNRKHAEEVLQSLNAALERRAEQLQNLAFQLTRTEERERRRIAQILHDDLQQILVAAKFSLGTLSSHVSEPETIHHGLEGVEGLLDEAIAASRSLTAELTPWVLYTSNLPDALRWLACWMETKYGTAVEVNADDGVHELDQDLSIIIFGVIREMLFNVVKHARVNRATVTLCCENDVVTASVRDEGVGFDPQAQEKGTEGTPGGFGLFAAKERLAAIGGRIKIESAIGHGTQSTIFVPARVTAGASHTC